MTTSWPNFLWISFEDTYPYYGCYGDPVARTPHVDQLAAEGTRWERGFSSSPVCSPARSAVITGMYAISIGTQHHRSTHKNPMEPELPTPYSAVVPPHVKCFPEYLRAAGYFCTNNEKTDYQFEVPFTAWDRQGNKAHWRDRPDPNQPFFSVFNSMKSHESGMWPERCPIVAFDPEDIKVPAYLPDTHEVRLALARMYTNLEICDHRLGCLLRQLEEDGLADNTYIFHWSDHGPLPRGKRWLFDSGIRVPLIVRGPNIPKDEVKQDLVSTVDLAPTVFSLAGMDVPAHLQGQPFLGPKAEDPRDYVYASRDRFGESYDRMRGVRDRRFKYIRNYYSSLPYNLWLPYLNRHPIMQAMWSEYRKGNLNESQSQLFRFPRPIEELYDTLADPDELRNLAEVPHYSKDIQRLRKALDTWMDDVGDLGAIPENEMVRSWYPDGTQPHTASALAVPLTEELPGIRTAHPHENLAAPALVQLTCATQGASIGYRLDEESEWRLYTGPIRLTYGTTVIRAKAIRIGYRESPETSWTFEASNP